jgi:hypothetical protein
VIAGDEGIGNRRDGSVLEDRRRGPQDRFHPPGSTESRWALSASRLVCCRRRVSTGPGRLLSSPRPHRRYAAGVRITMTRPWVARMTAQPRTEPAGPFAKRRSRGAWMIPWLFGWAYSPSSLSACSRRCLSATCSLRISSRWARVAFDRAVSRPRSSSSAMSAFWSSTSLSLVARCFSVWSSYCFIVSRSMPRG